jgi:hypothetical protein
MAVEREPWVPADGGGETEDPLGSPERPWTVATPDQARALPSGAWYVLARDESEDPSATPVFRNRAED